MKYNKINFFLPTYKRVENNKLPRLIRSIINNVSSLNNVCITFLVNVNDIETRDYLDRLTISISWERLYTNLKEPHLGKMYNQIFEQTKFKESSTLVSMIGDDMEWQTSGFDLAILDEVNKRKGWAVVYCNDGYIQGSKLMVNLFTTRKYVEATRHPFMCDKFQAYFIDTVWTKIAKKTGTAVYLNNIILKHHHYTKNPKMIDITSQRLQKVKMPFNKGYKIVDSYVNEIIKNLKGVL